MKRPLPLRLRSAVGSQNPEMPQARYDEIIEDDWRFDSRGREFLDYETFSDAMFCFMDLWCDDVGDRCVCVPACVRGPDGCSFALLCFAFGVSDLVALAFYVLLSSPEKVVLPVLDPDVAHIFLM